MAELATLARPYAEAVFELAKEAEGGFSRWSDALNFLGAVMQDAEVAAICANPRVEKEAQTALLLDIADGQNLDSAMVNLVKLLAENGKLTLIPELASQFDELKAKHEGYISVELISTYPVNEEQSQSVVSALKQRFGKEIELEVSLDESLLGGWVIRAGDQVLDLSVRGRLQQLAADLRH